MRNSIGRELVEPGGGSQAPMPVARALASGGGAGVDFSRRRCDCNRTRHARHRGSSPSVSTPGFGVPTGVGSLGYGLRRFAARLRAPRLVPHSDEESSHVFAVLPRLGKGGAGAIGLNPLGRQVDTDHVGLGVRAFDTTVSARFSDLDILDDTSSSIIQPSQEGTGAQEAA